MDYITLRRVNNFSKGLKNVKDASKKGLCDLETSTGALVSNGLNVNMLPRYSDEYGDIEHSAIWGDVFAAISEISRRLDKIEDDVKKISSNTHEINHASSHITVLENNLRSLRETLVFGEYTEDTVPKLKGGCNMEDG